MNRHLAAYRVIMMIMRAKSEYKIMNKRKGETLRKLGKYQGIDSVA